MQNLISTFLGYNFRFIMDACKFSKEYFYFSNILMYIGLENVLLFSFPRIPKLPWFVSFLCGDKKSKAGVGVF